MFDEQLPLLPDRLSGSSLDLLRRLRGRLGSLEWTLGMLPSSPEETEWFHLVATAAAPSGDPQSLLRVWDDGDHSVSFGGWHTHQPVWSGDEIPTLQLDHVLDIASAIVRDEVVLIEEVGGAMCGIGFPLAEGVEEAVQDLLTAEGAPPMARLRSWSGRLDRHFGLDDFA